VEPLPQLNTPFWPQEVLEYIKNNESQPELHISATAITRTQHDIMKLQPKEGSQYLLPCSIVSDSNQIIHTYSFSDDGATSSFVDRSFTRKHKIHQIPLNSPRHLTYIDDSNSSQSIIYAAIINIAMGSHTEQLVCYVADLGHVPLVLGTDWHKTHNPEIDFVQKSFHFCRSQCRDLHCHHNGVPAKIYCKGAPSHAAGPDKLQSTFLFATSIGLIEYHI